MSELVPVSAAVVAYHNREEILDCLGSLKAQTKGVDLSLYVVDNGSDDGTPAAVRAAFPDVTVIENGANLGFGAGHNKVLPLLASRYHVMVNPDITLEMDAVSRMASYMEDHPEAGLMMPDIRNPDGTRQILPKHDPTWWYMLAGKFLPSVRKAYCRGGEAMDRPTEIEFCSGCFMMIRTELFQKLGGFDERYFLYMEDADLSRRMRKLAKVIFYPGAQVVHAWHHDSAKSGKALKLHLASARKYFAKWRRNRA